MSLIPKGNPLHEIFHLIPYHLKSSLIALDDLVEEKHAFGKHSRQYFLYFHPKKDAPKRKQFIIYFHGGGWQFGKPELFRANAKVFTDQGYPIFCMSHRRIPFYDFQDMREDLTTGLRAVLNWRKKQNLPNENILLGGMSSGAHLAAMLLYDRKALEKIGLSQKIFSGIFVCGAPLDLSKMRKSFTLKYLKGNPKQSNYKSPNPIDYLQKEEQIPMLAIHGTKDGLVEYAAGKSFYDKLKSINPKLIQLHTIPNGTHLNAVNWVLENDTIRKLILNWISTLNS